MTIYCLGIETSCDDTSASVVSSDKKILSNVVLSQTKEHLPYNGVVPEIASRAHMHYLEFAIKEALKEANMTIGDIDCIAATGGPGLIGGVIVGTMFAKSIASVQKLPYIAVNHLEGHALSVRLSHEVSYPFLTLLASGGHCMFLESVALGNYNLIGQTQDDALGEAFDKVAKMLGLSYPGGPEIEKRALLGDENAFELPKPMCNRPGADMSFSGLKTAVRIIIENNENLSTQFVNDLCASFQKTAFEIIRYKTEEAIKLYEKTSENKVLVLCGGVAANKYITEKLDIFLKLKGYRFICPPLKLCTDNAAMIAWAGIEHFLSKNFTKLDFCPIARWPLYKK